MVNWFPALVLLKAFYHSDGDQVGKDGWVSGNAVCAGVHIAESEASLLFGSNHSLLPSPLCLPPSLLSSPPSLLFLPLPLSLPFTLSLFVFFSRKLNGCYFTNTNALQKSLFKSKLASYFQACCGGLNNNRTWPRSRLHVT